MVIDMLIPKLLDSATTAKILDVEEGTLSVWRSTGRYNLPYIKIGRKVRYREEDVLDFIESQIRTHTGINNVE